MGISDYSNTDEGNSLVPGSPPIELGEGVAKDPMTETLRRAIKRIMKDLKDANGTFAGSDGADGTIAGVKYTFSGSTSMANPGSGYIRFNDIFASTTIIAIHEETAAAVDISAWINAWDDGVGGQLIVTKIGAEQNFAIFDVTAVTDNTGWHTLTVSHVASGGSFSAEDSIGVSWVKKGDTDAPVASVNGQTGAVVLDADDIDDTATTNKFTTATEISKLAAIEENADVTDAGNVGSAIHGATAKTTPVDADTIGLIDSAASNVLKKLSWSNIKATLKTYFDTLYATASHTHDDRYYTETEVDGLIREKLTADRTYYVRTDGSDSNDGLTDNSGGAFLTIQKAWDVVAALDLSIYSATIQIGDGTYTAGLSATKNPVGGSGVTIQGNSSTPANVVVSTTSADALSFANITVPVTIKDLKIQTTTAGAGVIASNSVVRLSNLDFGACVDEHIRAYSQSNIEVTGDYSVTGGASRHIRIEDNSVYACSGRTVTSSGSLTFTQFMLAQNGAVGVFFSSTFTGGTITGKRYELSMLSGVNTFGGGASYFPGDSAGSTATGAQYA